MCRLQLLRNVKLSTAKCEDIYDGKVAFECLDITRSFHYCASNIKTYGYSYLPICEDIMHFYTHVYSKVTTFKQPVLQVYIILHRKELCVAKSVWIFCDTTSGGPKKGPKICTQNSTAISVYLSMGPNFNLGGPILRVNVLSLKLCIYISIDSTGVEAAVELIKAILVSASFTTKQPFQRGKHFRCLKNASLFSLIS